MAISAEFIMGVQVGAEYLTDEDDQEYKGVFILQLGIVRFGFWFPR